MTLFNFNHLPEVPPPNSITWGIRVSTYKLGVGELDTNIWSIASTHH